MAKIQKRFTREGNSISVLMVFVFILPLYLIYLKDINNTAVNLVLICTIVIKLCYDLRPERKTK
jgi:hypothetical protein